MDARAFAHRLLAGPTPFVVRGRSYFGLDCWGLVWLGYREVLGIELPSYVERYERVRPDPELSALISHESAREWQPVPEGTEQPMDVALFRYRDLPLHVGLLIDPASMLHIERGADVTREAVRGPVWGRRLIGIYRPRPA